MLKSSSVSAFYRKMKDAVRRKEKRMGEIKEKYLVHAPPVFKRQLRRLFTTSGIKKRMLAVQRPRLAKDPVTRQFYWKKEDGQRKFRGNYIAYAHKASEIMQEPAIKRQLRNTDKIFQREMRKKGLL
jgi:hypothetical protein